LGTCWIGAFKEDETKKILSVPDDVRVVAMTPLGYPNQPPSQKSRKSLDQIICFEKYE
jgi:nitroreductase